MKSEQCTSSQGTEGGYLPTSSSDTVQLSLLSGIPMPAKFSEKEPQTDGSPDCKCGKEMSECSIHPNTPEAWTAFMRDSLVKTLASLENRQAYLREPDQVFTEKYCASLAWYDLNTFSWKTSQQSLVTDWEPYSETWPRWGMTLNGSAYVHPMSERRITETGGLHWPTPMAKEGSGGGSAKAAALALSNTPRDSGASRTLKLRDAVKMWPTPTCQVGAMYLETNALQRNSMSLASAVHYVPTPMARDWKGHTNNPQARGYGMGLPDYVKQNSAVTGQLNPTWVEWLMGFPIGFTASKDWVTPKSRSKPQPHGKCSEGSE